MSRDRKSRRGRSKSRDLESRRRSRRRSQGRKKSSKKTSKHDKKRRTRSVERSRRTRYKVRDEEKPLSDASHNNGQQQESSLRVTGIGANDLMMNNGASQVQQPPNAFHGLNYDPNQKAFIDNNIPRIYDQGQFQVQDLSIKDSSFKETCPMKTVVKRVKRTNPNIASNYNSFSVLSKQVDGKMVHTVGIVTTENVAKKVNFESQNNLVGHKNILNAWEVQKICKNIKNGVKFGNIPGETINPGNFTNIGIGGSPTGVVFKTKENILLNNREILLARMNKLKNKIRIN
uniref:SNRNP27 domain-containing protein n=1 Tax=Parastrongyloides trichosuri TaxID=131310 RepID=A0A0N4ZX36_PARTI